ncbi:MAG: hypothetical protein ACFFDW_00145 [Candidatus Thorarchaeota archaeon]
MHGNPVSYRNLYRHLNEILNYLEISLDSDFVLEELNLALIEAERIFGNKHQLPSQIRNMLKILYNNYIDRKALPLDENDERKVRNSINEWLKKYYQKAFI